MRYLGDMNSNGRTAVSLQFVDGKLQFLPFDELMDAGIMLTSNLQIVWNQKRNELSINSPSDGACVMHFEVHDGKLECTYFDADYVD
jgi:hypothetical protein